MFTSCSTFEEYQQELDSGLLKWSTPTHTDDDFWRENAKKLNGDNKQCVKFVPCFSYVLGFFLIMLMFHVQDPYPIAQHQPRSCRAGHCV